MIEAPPRDLKMNPVCHNCASGLEENAVVCVHCGIAVGPEDASEPAHAAAPQQAIASVEPSATTPPEAAPMFAMGNGLSGIGGWLILVAIGLAVGPFFRLRGIVTDSQFIFNSQYQAAMSARPGLEAIIFYELVTNSFFLAFLLLLNFLFYRKRRSFPAFMIFNLGAQFVTQLIDHLWAMHFSHSGEWNLVLQTLVAAAIWIPYMLNSVRVEQTFVN
ncbi:MAG TPA: DUF2569 domain-containing protein [Terracidiphilus sp.]|nr:DUF2569 domain-containing protein [Terracidiphilus sp.]